MRSSRLVAESLRVMPQPVGGSLPPADFAPGEPLRRQWRHAWQPLTCDALPPICLYPAQRPAWRRAIAAIDRFGGVIVAEPVGSGKTWLALATAIHYGESPLVIGPAALEQQWRRVAERAGVDIKWLSHERLSRGATLPDASLAIVDEAHRFRHLATRRTVTLAPWIAARRAMLLTATPLINRRADLLALLRLMFADDVLCLDGLRSLRDLLELRNPPLSLRRIVIRSAHPGNVLPVRDRRLECSPAEEERGRLAVAMVEQMTLAESAGVRNLLRAVLIDASASSDAAFHAALRRYRALLLQSRDAGGLSRSALRQFAGAALDQVVLWPLLGDLPVEGAPRLEDLEVVEAALAAPQLREPWLDDIGKLLGDGRVTVCFARHRATAALLVRELGDNTAWVNGSAGGIGPHRLPREKVLAAFGLSRAEWRVFRNVPNCLVATEVASEGLDLQGASRVIHLDLPWHAARLDQRVGRVRRIGQVATEVEVITRAIPSTAERVLRIDRMIRHKGRLASRWLERLSLDATSVELASGKCWLAVAVPELTRAEAHALVGIVAGNQTGTVALELVDGSWRAADSFPTDLPALVPASEQTEFERSRLRRLARRACWRALELARPQVISRPRLVSRLLALGREARIARDRVKLELLDRLLAASGRAHPLGISNRLDALADANDDTLLGCDVPAVAAPENRRIDWLAVILYRREKRSLR
jgi:hypothetical protein